jgi:chromosome partitioning protein
MTRIIALANQKGGVGKTTTAVNLGAALAALGQRVLIIDLDAQANATAALGMRASAGRSTYDLLLGESSLWSLLQPTPVARLWIAPSSPDLAGAEVELAPALAREFRLRRAIEGKIDRFTFVLVDCPPSLGLVTVNALTAADEVIVPVQCEYLALEGLGQFTKTLELVRRNLNQDLKLRGLLLTMYDRRTNLSQQVADEVRRHFSNTFHAVIPRSVRLSEAPSHGLPINMYEPDSPAAEAYDALAREVLNGVRSTVEAVT